ncbi:hypothetical protein BDK51DRAFT_32598 [Blyttiomyces helicus]|uniref:Uncharacterized protein n=1 Tax=Blyttiomyces helicus TaxID=388810 RepID=A0A4P9W149_9FUNG|nr:hypothetical protein BDK51DRAFT_32598 [Blyttiomyces helicus]|eukprot:RKO85065.1 hypothetical protein BDK51DRAFT_32598 [Blyttiomyces helicus]
MYGDETELVVNNQKNKTKLDFAEDSTKVRRRQNDDNGETDIMKTFAKETWNIEIHGSIKIKKYGNCVRQKHPKNSSLMIKFGDIPKDVKHDFNKLAAGAACPQGLPTKVVHQRFIKREVLAFYKTLREDNEKENQRTWLKMITTNTSSVQPRNDSKKSK